MNRKLWRLFTFSLIAFLSCILLTPSVSWGQLAFTLDTKIITQDNLHFGRELILEDTTAYKDSNHIYVQGKIRNGSRSPIRNRVYAIAYFFGEQSQYLGLQTKQINSQIILPNQTITFYFKSLVTQQLDTNKIKLKFQGENSETRVDLYPTNQEKTIIYITK